MFEGLWLPSVGQGLEEDSLDVLPGTVSQQMPKSPRKFDWLSVCEEISARWVSFKKENIIFSPFQFINILTTLKGKRRGKCSSSQSMISFRHWAYRPATICNWTNIFNVWTLKHLKTSHTLQINALRDKHVIWKTFSVNNITDTCPDKVCQMFSFSGGRENHLVPRANNLSSVKEKPSIYSNWNLGKLKKKKKKANHWSVA